jgi:hypothetical protein
LERTVWGEEAEFANRDDASEIATFLMRHWNAITSALSDEEFYWFCGRTIPERHRAMTGRKVFLAE